MVLTLLMRLITLRFSYPQENLHSIIHWADVGGEQPLQWTTCRSWSTPRPPPPHPRTPGDFFIQAAHGTDTSHRSQISIEQHRCFQILRSSPTCWIQPTIFSFPCFSESHPQTNLIVPNFIIYYILYISISHFFFRLACTPSSVSDLILLLYIYSGALFFLCCVIFPITRFKY